MNKFAGKEGRFTPLKLKRHSTPSPNIQVQENTERDNFTFHILSCSVLSIQLPSLLLSAFLHPRATTSHDRPAEALQSQNRMLENLTIDTLSLMHSALHAPDCYGFN
jgi:hypothetical protein